LLPCHYGLSLGKTSPPTTPGEILRCAALLLKVTLLLLAGVSAVVLFTTPSSASWSPSTNYPPYFRARAIVWPSSSCTARRFSLFSDSSHVRVARGDQKHRTAVNTVRLQSAFYGQVTIAVVTTSNPSTTLAGFVTFSGAAGTALRSRAQQQRVRCRALDRRDPSTIIPNTPTPAHALLVRPTPPLTLAAHAGRQALSAGAIGGRWVVSMDQRHFQQWPELEHSGG